MSNAFRFGRFELRPDERALLCEGEPVRLGGRAFDILVALIERRDRLVSFDELLDVVWPGLAVEENNLSVQVSTLRRILGPNAITTVRGKGYRFTCPAQVGAAPDDVMPARGGAVQRGALVATVGASASEAPQQAGGWWTDLGGRPVTADEDGCCIVFDRVRPAVVAALRARALEAPVPLQVGLLAVDIVKGEELDRDAVRRARALASQAGGGDIWLTADLATEFVAGVDGEVEDLGDTPVAGEDLRVFRVRPFGPVMSVPPVSVPLPARLGLRPSIVMLPLVSPIADGDPEELLGEALADDVIAHLSRLQELSVISGLSSRRLRRCGFEPARRAGLLDANFMLTGTYRRMDDRVLVRLRLEDTASGEVLCPIEAVCGLREAFDPCEPLGGLIAEQVAQALFARAVTASRGRSLPEVDGHALLMGAIALMHRGARPEFERAHAMLLHLAQRPGCRGVVSAWLAKWHVLRVVQGWSVDPSADASLALDLVGRSLDEDSQDALALSIGGLVHAYLRKDLHVAGAMYEEAIEANPSEPLAWLFSATRLAYLGRGRAAQEAGDRALRLSPIDPMKYFFDSLAATASLADGGWERSEALCRRSLRANRSHASTWRTLAFALVMLNRMDEAREAVQRLRLIEPGFTVSRFRERFPGRDGPMAAPWAEALKAAGLPA